MFESIISRPAPPPPAPFVFSSTLVEKKKVPLKRPNSLNFCTESHLFRKSHFDRINKFVEAHSYHFTPLDSLHDNISDTDDDSDSVS